MSPAVGGCSYSSNLATALGGATAGSYAGTISLTAPAGLPPISNPPPGFSAANFVPLFYVTLQLMSFTGTISPDNPSISVTVSSITSASSSSNFFIGNWSGTGTTAPGISSTTFTGWSYNNSQTGPADVPLTVTPPNTLSLPAYACTPSTSCSSTAFTTPVSFTLVQVVGYFT